jgi:predicted phage tail protein
MLMQVKLLGDLGQKFGRHYEFVADSPREVISALSNQLAGFKQYLCEAHERNVAFKLVDDDPEGMAYENTVMHCKRLIIAPMVMGGGSAGKILLGVGLIALSFVSFGAGAFAGVGGLSAATSWQPLQFLRLQQQAAWFFLSLAQHCYLLALRSC